MSEHDAYEALEQAVSNWLTVTEDEARMATAWLVIIAAQNVEGGTSYEVALSADMAPHTGYGLVHKLGQIVHELEEEDE